MKLLDVSPGEARSLAASPTTPEQVHVFDRREIEAVNAALAARRPLLVRGEPGIGKSQLARAVAKAMGRAFLQHVVDARTESRDLQWHFDAVARLADAQLMGALGRGEGQDETQALDESQAPVRARDRLAIQHYIHPRALWWAFDWDSATS
jgi:MoxR-like ATPase